MRDVFALYAQGERQECGRRRCSFAVVDGEVDDEFFSSFQRAVAANGDIVEPGVYVVNSLLEESGVGQVNFDVVALSYAEGANKLGAIGQAEAADDGAVVFEIGVVLYFDAAFAGGIYTIDAELLLAAVAAYLGIGVAAAVCHFVQLQRAAVVVPHVAQQFAVIVVHDLVDDGGNAAFAAREVVVAAVQGAGIAFDGEAYAAAVAQVFAQ